MCRYWWSAALLTVVLVGCGQGTRVEAPKDPGDDKQAGDLEAGKLEPSLVQLLRAPRKDLAALCDETAVVIRTRKAALEGKDASAGPLGVLRPVPTLPVFREAKFSAATGFSLPPYLKEGRRDAAVALHLARHGDAEAARKLIEPTDRDTLARIDGLALATNVPLEWTRLVALRQHAALLRLAMDDSEGATELVTLHRQTREALGAKGADGPLGAALLGRGHRALELAAAAWRERKRTNLAEQADKVLRGWGEVPSPTPGVTTGQRWAEAVRILEGKEDGRMARAEVLRGLDLLALPLPETGAQTVLAVRDGDRLGEVLVLYHTVGGRAYRDPSHLAFGLEDVVAGVADEGKKAALARRTYAMGPTVCEVAVTPRTGLLSGFVRVNAGKALAVATLPRDLGSVHLDRPFEQNRVQVAPSQKGDAVRSSQSAVVARVANPLKPTNATRVELRREAGHSATDGVTLFYAPADSSPTLSELAAPAWAAWGPGRFDAGDDEQGGHLGLSWSDARTRVVLRLPYTQTESVALDVEDTRPDVVRDDGSQAFDRNERQARLAAGKPLVRLPRGVEPIAVQLGMSRDQATQAMPSGRGVYTREIPGGLMTTLVGETAKGATSAARQVFVRFDRDGKVAEVRVRFQELMSGPQKRGTKDLYDGLVKQCGTGLEKPAPWATVWPDRKSTMHAWRDDLTVMTCQIDAAGAEVVVRDCPPEQPEGVSLAALEYLPRGPEGCTLGETREELLRRWDVKQPTTTADGAVVLNAPKGSPFDVLLVYFAEGKVDRVLARYAQAKPLSPQPNALAEAVSDAWGRELRTVGWPRRQDAGTTGTTQSLSFHDERTLVKLFWQDDSRGKPSLFTEWRGAPR
jgi:hypothetical protein